MPRALFYQDRAEPIAPQQPDQFIVAQIMAAIKQPEERPVFRRWMPEQRDFTWPSQLGDPRPEQTSVSSWSVDNDPAPRATRVVRQRCLEADGVLVQLAPPPDFGHIAPTDILYYRVSSTDQVYFRESAPSADRAPYQANTGLTGSVSTIVTMGFGSFGSVNLLPTLGYSINAGSGTSIVDQVFTRVVTTDQVFRRAN